ncbi:NADH-quinone oxidoreductase subunit L, partial [Campylobacter jejuni]|nr:NADH-quinone oxidoreductase subunit L [Campylobacter jejuni]
MQNLALISLFSPFVAFLFASCFALSEKKQFVGIFCSLLVALSCFLFFCICFFVNEAFNVSLFE